MKYKITVTVDGGTELQDDVQKGHISEGLTKLLTPAADNVTITIEPVTE